MGLVLKEHKPVLCLWSLTVINFYRNNNRAGVVLFRYFHICKLAVSLELLHSHERNIHKGDEFLFLFVICLVELISCSKIVSVSTLDGLFVESVAELYINKLCSEGCVTAVV